MKVRSLQYYSYSGCCRIIVPHHSQLQPLPMYGKAVTEHYGVHEKKPTWVLKNNKKTKTHCLKKFSIHSEIKFHYLNKPGQKTCNLA